MTTFVIPAELYVRLAVVALQPGEDSGGRNWMRGIRIEYRAGRCIALATCGNLLAGEFVGEVGDPDDAITITIDPKLLEMAKIGAALSENLVISQAPGWTVITTTSGTMLGMNGEIDGSGWPDWRALLPADLPTKNSGCWAFNGERMARICRSAPSGAIRCARNIDIAVPTIVRDCKDENWFGVFMCSENDGKQSYSPATIPDFLK